MYEVEAPETKSHRNTLSGRPSGPSSKPVLWNGLESALTVWILSLESANSGALHPTRLLKLYFVTRYGFSFLSPLGVMLVRPLTCHRCSVISLHSGRRQSANLDVPLRVSYANSL